MDVITAELQHCIAAGGEEEGEESGGGVREWSLGEESGGSFKGTLWSNEH